MRKRIIISTLILLVGATLILTNTKKQAQEITIEDLENNKSMAIYIKDENGNYNKTSNIPTSGYTLNTTKSVCTNNATPSWNIKTNSLKISNLTSNNTGCYLYFDKLNNLQIEMANAKPSPDGFTGIADTDEGMFYAEDDWGTTYYYRGAVTDNWFKFANFYWRIIRINGDGSIRLIYNGTATDQTGEGTQISTSKYNASYNDNAYVGYMYGAEGASTYAATHANTNDSEIKTTVENWYRDNLLTYYDRYISKDAGFCNDRSIAGEDETWWSADTKKGFGTNATAYGPHKRILNSEGSYNSKHTPNFKCTNVGTDLFTTSTSTKGNKNLTYPVGLITADEVVYAGGFGGTANSSYYLYTKQNYWTASPSFMFTDGYARAFSVYSAGFLNNGTGVNYAMGIRPVINLATGVKLIGDGTASNPYQIEGVE